MAAFTQEVSLTNHRDSVLADNGSMPRRDVRSATVQALVGVEARMLRIPESLRDVLGLDTVRTHPLELADSTIVDCDVAEAVVIRCLGETVTCQALVIPGEGRVELGAFPLAGMALSIDASGQRLVPAGPFSTGLAILDGQVRT